MPKAACCCNVCSWCDHNHDTIDWYNPNHLWYNQGNLEQCRQPNWNILGTLTTEIPSIGHCMTKFICRSSPGTGFSQIDDLCTLNPDCPPFNCVRGKNLDTYGKYEYSDNLNGFSGTSYFRTPSNKLNTESYFWGQAFYYGEIYPCWFNGLNMTNIENDSDEFLEFTFNLKVEKWNGNTYENVVGVSFAGPGKNLHPHPDACSSYNVAGSDYYEWINLTECYDFHSTDDFGEYVPCALNFAKMPRGPWPYRFKRNIQPETGLDEADGFEFPCRAWYPDGSPGGRPYTKEEVLRAQSDPSFIGTELLDDLGNVIGIVGPNILYCPLSEQSCSTSQFGSNEECCTQPYCTSSEICYELDEEGTPFGWEDVPTGCSAMSNYGGSFQNRRFFCWWDPANRYTTPEWDVTDNQTNQKRKLSIHVVVPTKMFKPEEGSQYPTGFCYPSYGQQGRSFGEWSFGMDCEATNGEIELLERAGYVWSNGREEDGVWINRTPTNALRILFTMDHADLGQGKVWRAFRDWNVKIPQGIEKIFNKGTPQETKFKITLEQKVEEKHFASLGCDCPSGYLRAGPTGNTGNTGTTGASGSSGYSGYTGPTGAYRRILPSACDDSVKSCDIPIPGTTQFIAGFTVDNHLHCMNDLYGEGSKISFAERGPIVLNMNVETSGFGCIVCNSHNSDAANCECSSTIGGTTKIRTNDRLNGLKMILHTYNGRTLPEQVNVIGDPMYYWPLGAWPSAVDPAYLGSFHSKYFGGVGILSGTCPQPYDFQQPPQPVYNIFKEHGTRWLRSTADLPYPSGYGASPMGGARYRNSYIGVYVPESVENDYYNGFLDPCGNPLYGEQQCNWVSICPPPGNAQENNLHYHPVFNEKPEDFPQQGPIGKCAISCNTCHLKSEAVPCPGDGNSGGGGDPPTPCACCPQDLYDSTEPPGLNCPPVENSDCESDPNNPGLQPRCADRGDPSCYCTECIPQPPIPDGCPHLVSETEVGVGFGSFRYNDWECSTNIISPTGRAGEAGCWDCADSASRGVVVNTCYGYPNAAQLMFGMDTERLYFRTEGSNNAIGHLGSLACKDYLECGCLGNAQGTNCMFISCVDGYPREYLNYCRGQGQVYGWAFGDITINWRKYLCQERTEKGKLFDPNIIENLLFECNAEGSNCGQFNYLRDYPTLPDACKHIWRTLNGSCDNIPNTGGLALFYESLCGIGSSCTPRQAGIKVELSKFEIDNNDRGWLPFETTYEPNPNRTLLAKNRSHIIITPKGKIF